MTWSVDGVWLVMAFAAVSALGFLFGQAIDAILGDDGFGSFATMVLFTVGFFGAIHLAKRQAIPLHGLAGVVSAGMIGALALVGVLVILKAGLSRLLR